jgi:protein phosphatase
MRLPRRRSHPSPADIAGASDPGPRPENQDRWAAGPGWAVVCDGVGGHAGGAVAAQTALDVVVAHLVGAAPRTVAAAERVLRAAAEAANAAVRAGRTADPAVADMATTVTAAVLVGRRWIVLQVGDSPAWRVGPTTARSVTWDHNLVGDLVRTGALPAADAIGHRGRHIVTRALGPAAEIEPELFTVVPHPGEALVLASDGLSDVAGPEAAVPICATATAPDAAGAARALVALALGRGTRDNVTVVVAR